MSPKASCVEDLIFSWWHSWKGKPPLGNGTWLEEVGSLIVSLLRVYWYPGLTVCLSLCVCLSVCLSLPLSLPFPPSLLFPPSLSLPLPHPWLPLPLYFLATLRQAALSSPELLALKSTQAKTIGSSDHGLKPLKPGAKINLLLLSGLSQVFHFTAMEN